MSINRKKTFVVFISIFSLILVWSSVSGKAKADVSEQAETKRVEKSIEVISEIMEIPEEGIPEALLGKAYGVAILPGVIKAAYVIGGQHGKGILMVQDKRKWSNPSFITITGGSIGWQIGVQKADIILVFKSQASIDNITQGKFTLGVDASIVAGPVGRRAEASTDIDLEAEIYSYSRSKGLFAGISIKGASLQIDYEANAAFYESRMYSPQDILMEKDIKAPAIVKELKKTLAKYTEGIGPS
jgi:lipid-binding SYLF domain-containing protein